MSGNPGVIDDGCGRNVRVVVSLFVVLSIIYLPFIPSSSLSLSQGRRLMSTESRERKREGWRFRSGCRVGD